MLLFIIHDFDQQYEGIIKYNFSTKEFHAGWVRATSLKKVHKLLLQNEVGTRQVVQKCPLFINVHTIEIVNTGG